VYKRVDPKTHTNVLDGLLAQLRKRDGVAFMKRLTIVLDEDSEKGFGLVRALPFPPLTSHTSFSFSFIPYLLRHSPFPSLLPSL
jgi:hypothetical protein